MTEFRREILADLDLERDCTVCAPELTPALDGLLTWFICKAELLRLLVLDAEGD